LKKLVHGLVAPDTGRYLSLFGDALLFAGKDCIPLVLWELGLMRLLARGPVWA